VSHILGDLPMGNKMNKHGHGAKPRRLEDDEPSETLVELESASFLQFNHSIDSQLTHLVQRWAHTAAPCAMRSAGSRMTLPRKPAKPK
jgi:hypothetical protein